MSKTTTVELPTGAALERAIAEIESDTNDEQIRQTIIERLKIADEPETVFVPHDKAFSASRDAAHEKAGRQKQYRRSASHHFPPELALDALSFAPRPNSLD